MIAFRLHRFLCVLVLALVGTPAFGQTKPALLYSLPPDGTWVEFEMTRPGGEAGHETARLRLGSVGKEVVNGAPHRWIEIRRETATEGKPMTVLAKILIAESAFGDSTLKKESVAKAFEQKSSQMMRRLSPEQADDLITFGFRGDSYRLIAVNDKEELTTPLGKFSCKQMKSSSAMKGLPLEMNVWLTRDVPFGWARAEVGVPGAPKVVVVAVKTGKDAKSELDETKAK